MSDDVAFELPSLGDTDAVPSPAPKRRGPKPGSRKPEGSGRQKGTKNRRNQQVADLLAELKCDPLVGLARIAMNKKVDPSVRAKCFADLAKYRYPQLRATEVTGANGGPLGLTLVDFLKALPDE
jgi:hypothetical protein